MSILVKYRIYCLLALMLAVPVSGFTQSPYFRTLKSNAISPEAKVTKVFQDSKGFIWMTASDGLYKYDGHKYQYYARHDGKPVEATAFYEHKNGLYWIGYKDGVINRIHAGHMRAFWREEGYPAEAITDIIADSNGTTWLATYGEGLYCYTGKRLYNFNKDDGLIDNYVYDMIATADGSVWAGTDGGIAICGFVNEQKSVDMLTMNEGLPDNIIMSLYNDGTYIWIGSQAKGVCRYNLKRKQLDVPQSKDAWRHGAVYSLTAYMNEIWAGTGNGGVVVLDEQSRELSNFNRTNSPLMSRITSITSDMEGNIWISDNTAQVFVTNPSLRFFKVSANAEPVQALLRDTKGNTWYATNEHTYILSPTGTKSSLDIAAISMYEDQYGCIWLGTFGDGIYRFMSPTSEPFHITERQGLVNNNVLSIDGHGNELWFSTLGGVSRCVLNDMKNIAFTNFGEVHGLGTNFIYQVFIDSKGRVWFATDGKGITVYDKGRFLNYTESAGLKSGIVYSITEDIHGNIWFSTANAGVYSFDGKRFTTYTEGNGLKAESIAGLSTDEQGNILVFHKNGIDVVTETTSIHNYGIEAGVGNIDPSLNAVYKDHEGYVWVGAKGIIIRYSSLDKPVKRTPLTQINQVLVYLTDSVMGKREFGYNKNHISFDYVGLWYRDPDEVIYRLKLEGYDMDWAVSRNSIVTYPNLPPGDYTFKVQSSANAAFAGADMKAYSFTIAPPFWNTIWFYSFSAIGLGMGLVLFVRNRENRLRKEERLAKDKVEFQFETLKSQVNPHFLFNSFNTLISIIEKDSQTAVEYVERLSDFYRNILLRRQQNEVALKEELEMLEQYFYLQQKRFKDNLVLETVIPVTYLGYRLAPLTLQLLAENAIKHNTITRESPLIISLHIEEGKYLVMKNNKRLKAHPEPSTGLGLQNIRNRYRLLGKREVIVENTDMDFIVKIPLIKP